jgi:tripeptide aminopeptidase
VSGGDARVEQVGASDPRPTGAETGAGFSSPLAAELADDVLERFFRYARIDTQSRPHVDRVPSTESQFELARPLVGELRELGVLNVAVDDHAYVYATLPGTVEDVPVLGLIAHLDTSPDASGSGVQPQLHRAYDGGELVLPGDPGVVLRPGEMPELGEHAGHDIVTSDGTTLLGADDKAGIAEIMAAVAFLVAHPQLARGRVRIAFTPDEEVGHSVDLFDLERFAATAAFTVDGEALGEIQAENFYAADATVTIVGQPIHTGRAKGKLVNSLRLAGEYLQRLPSELAPETTEGREGFVHPDRMTGSMAEATIELLARDFDEARLEQHCELLRRIGRELERAEPRARVRVEITQQYRNMRPYLEKQPQLLRAAEIAVSRAGVRPAYGLLRGGTDGAILSERGLPTPNLFTGSHEYHSLREWVCVQDMAAAAATIVHLVQAWAELSAGH